MPFPLEATIPELQSAMESGDLTAVELVAFYLARIAAYDDAGPTLNAFIYVNPAARDEAAALDAERAASGPRGPLHGIPVVIKDNIDTADIIGKTNLHEFANGWQSVSSLGGQTLSPYDPTHDPGGSSGGTAVAVSANFAMAGWGTDTCGSVRYPAVLNDLYGLRPTEGLSSRSGVIPLSTTLDTMGPMARNVVDLALVLDATVGVDPADPTTVPVDASYVDAVDPDGLSGRRIGLLASTLPSELDQLMTQAIGDMEANGVEVIDLALPIAVEVGMAFDEFDSALNHYLAAHPNAPVHSVADLAAFFREKPELDYAGFRTYTGDISLDTDRYRTSIANRPVFRDAVVALMDEQDLDAIVYPESTRGAPLLGLDYSIQPWDCSTAPHGGLPALSVPMGFTSEGLPVGFEFMGRPFSEETLIAMAAGYEAHTNHRLLPPTTPPL